MKMLAFPDLVLRPYPDASQYTMLNVNRETAGRLRYVRVYEKLMASSVTGQVGGGAIPVETWDVVRDALIDLRYDRAKEIVMGVLGPWRPSTVMVNDLRDGGAQRYLMSNFIASAAWNVDLDYPVVPNSMYRLDLFNEEPYERTIRAYLVIDTGPVDDPAPQGMFDGAFDVDDAEPPQAQPPNFGIVDETSSRLAELVARIRLIEADQRTARDHIDKLERSMRERRNFNLGSLGSLGSDDDS